MKFSKDLLYLLLFAFCIFLLLVLLNKCKFREGLDQVPKANAMCASQYPFIENGVLYGTVARNNPGKSDCGKCWEVEFENVNPESKVTKAYLQQTNLGDDVHGWGDFLVPGGGFGKFTGCDYMKGWKVYTHQGGPCDPNNNTEECALYGGFKNQELCKTAFPGDPLAQKACNDVLWGVFPEPDGAGFPGNLKVKRFREVTSPPQFKNMSGVGGEGDPKPLGDWQDGGGAELTHYWDCCKSACSWGDAPNPMMVCGATGEGPMTKPDDSVKSICDIKSDDNTPSPKPEPGPSPTPKPGPGPSPSPAPGPDPKPQPGPKPPPGPDPPPKPEPGPSPTPKPHPGPTPSPAPVPHQPHGGNQPHPVPTHDGGHNPHTGNFRQHPWLASPFPPPKM